MAHAVQTPHGRGYDSGLTYFDYMTGAPAGLCHRCHCCDPSPSPPLADFWAENRMNCGTKKAPLPTVDMWDTDGPGYGLNGSWACNQTAQAGCTYQVRPWEGRRRRQAA